MLDRLREIIAQRCENWGGEIIEFKGEPDHVHILVELPSNLELSRFVNNVKTTSSRLVRRLRPGTAWCVPQAGLLSRAS
jgi:putative transposase